MIASKVERMQTPEEMTIVLPPAINASNRFHEIALPLAEGGTTRPGQELDPLLRKAAELVQQLGNDDFNLREKAEMELTTLAKKEIKVLNLVDQERRNADPEIANRCTQIVANCNEAYDTERAKQILQKMDERLKPLDIQVSSLKQLFELERSVTDGIFDMPKRADLQLVYRNAALLDALRLSSEENDVLLRQAKIQLPMEEERFRLSREEVQTVSGTRYLAEMAKLYARQVYLIDNKEFIGANQNGKIIVDQMLRSILDRPALKTDNEEDIIGRKQLHATVKQSGILERDPEFKIKFQATYGTTR